MSSEFDSECDHTFACIMTHPTDASFILEGCATCGVIRNYNIDNGESNDVCTGCRPITMTPGPNGSILVLEKFLFFSRTLSKFMWDKERRKLSPVERMFIQSGLLQICYSKRFDMFVAISGPGEIVAVKLGCDIPIRMSFEVVIDHIWKFVVVHGVQIWKFLEVHGSNIWKFLVVHGGHIWKSFREGSDHIWKSFREGSDHIWKSFREASDHIWKSFREGSDHIWKSFREGSDHIWKSFREGSDHIWQSFREASDHI